MEPTYTMRPDKYVRKFDGQEVAVADWTDGDVTWMLTNPPVVGFSNIAGTCAATTFERCHVKVCDAKAR